MNDVFAEIRAGCAAVAEAARHVRIDEAGLRAFATRLQLDVPDDDPGHERLGDDESTAAFVMTLDAINFGSGYFPHIRKRPGMSGYHTVAAALRDHATGSGPLTAAGLRQLTVRDCARIFDQDLEARWPAELMGHFATALNDMGEFVDRVGDGRFLGLVAAAEQRAARLVDLLAEMPYFRDVHTHRGDSVPLYKRAQITAYDLAVTFDHSGPGHFEDIDRATMFADNLVPHVLRVEGVLRFSTELLDRIEQVEDIPIGSEPEVEIRACGLHAVEQMTTLLRDQGRAVSAGDLDGVLWRMGARPEYKSAPRHRTRCVFY